MEYIIDCNMTGGAGKSGGSSGNGAPLPAALTETVTVPTLAESVAFDLVTV